MVLSAIYAQAYGHGDRHRSMNHMAWEEAYYRYLLMYQISFLLLNCHHSIFSVSGNCEIPINSSIIILHFVLQQIAKFPVNLLCIIILHFVLQEIVKFPIPPSCIKLNSFYLRRQDVAAFIVSPTQHKICVCWLQLAHFWDKKFYKSWCQLTYLCINLIFIACSTLNQAYIIGW